MMDPATGYNDEADRIDRCAECGDELTPDEARICRYCCDQQTRFDEDGPTEDDLYPSADDAHGWEDGDDFDDWPERPRGV